MGWKKLTFEKKLFYILLVILLLSQTLFLARHMSGFESVPTCIYGCAPWMTQGFLKDLISNPGNIWNSDALSYEEFPAVMPKGTEYMMLGIYKLISPITGWDYFESWRVIIPFTILLFIIFYLLSYYVMLKITKSEYFSLLFAVLFNSMAFYPVFMYSSLLKFFVFFYMGLLLLFALKKNFSWKKDWYSIILFILFGVIMFHFHPGLTVAIIFITIASVFVKYWDELISFDFKAIFKSRFFQILLIIIMFSGIISLALPWWNHVIFESHGNIAQDTKLNDSPDLQNPKLYFSRMPYYIKSLLGNYSTITSSIITLISYLGLVSLFYKKKYFKTPKELNFITATFFLGFIFCCYHYLITSPLFAKDLSPGRLMSYTLPGTLYLLAISGLFVINNFYEKKIKPKIKKQPWFFESEIKLAITIFIILILFVGAVGKVNAKADGKFYKFAFNADDDFSYNIYKTLYYEYFADKNPDDAIVLTTNELAFTLHNLVGVNIINGRFGYYYQYVDYQPYWFDSAVMLYGTNEVNRRNTIEKYLRTGKDLYLYWDYFWPRSEYVFDEKGQPKYYNNPLKFYSPEYKQKLTDNGILFIEDKQSFEPNTYNRPEFRKFDLAVVAIQNYRSGEQPWKEGLDPYLTEVWSHDHNGQKVAALYKISLPE